MSPSEAARIALAVAVQTHGQRLGPEQVAAAAVRFRSFLLGAAGRFRNNDALGGVDGAAEGAGNIPQKLKDIGARGVFGVEGLVLGVGDGLDKAQDEALARDVVVGHGRAPL